MTNHQYLMSYRHCAGPLMVSGSLSCPSRWLVSYYYSAHFADEENEVKAQCPNPYSGPNSNSSPSKPQRPVVIVPE